MKEKCLTTDCCIAVKKKLQEQIVIPFKDGTKDMQKLFSFFMYNAPNIESVHSKRLNSTVHSDVINKMFEHRHFKYQKFCWSNAVIEDELYKGFLIGDEICLKCKRFVCKKRKTEKGKPTETDLECFLRHIRNAIAHGRVYYCHAGNRVHIVFEDKNPSKKLSARIVCIKADLEYWKNILSDSRYS